MTYHNRYLWPMTEKPIKHVIVPTTAGNLISQASNLLYKIGGLITERDYAYPHHEVMEQVIRIKATTGRITATFPPPPPENGDIVVVLDDQYNARKLHVNASNLEALTAEVYLDLDTGEWVTFSRIPHSMASQHFGYTYIHPSRAAKYDPPEIPE